MMTKSAASFLLPVGIALIFPHVEVCSQLPASHGHPMETVTTLFDESSDVNWCNAYLRVRCKGLVGIFCVYTVCTFYLLTLMFPA